MTTYNITAATNGYSRAYFDLAEMLWKGTGVNRNTDEAFKWMRKARENNRLLGFDLATWLEEAYTETGITSYLVDALVLYKKCQSWHDMGRCYLWRGGIQTQEYQILQKVREFVSLPQFVFSMFCKHRDHCALQYTGQHGYTICS